MNRYNPMNYRSIYRCPLAVIAVTLIASNAAASGIRETETFAPVVEQAQEYAAEFGGKNVLLVVDIDNTLLAMDRQLGSDQWFEWQEHLLKHEPKSPHLVAPDFGKLLEVQGILFATTGMHPPEAQQPHQVAVLQGLGLQTLVLTSRGDAFRTATTRELDRAGYDFSNSSPPIRLFARNGTTAYETCSRFVPYQTDSPAAYGLQADEIQRFNLSDNPREISYGDGVLMTAGQHKGAMLLIFLHLVNKQYDAVLYVDDHGRHVSRVYDALTHRNIEVTTFHYTHEDDRVDQFAYGDKTKVTRQWRRLARVLGPTKQQDKVAELAAP